MRVALCVVLLALAGCVTPQGATLPDDAFWMIWVRGDEPPPCEARGGCSIAECDLRYDHGVDPEARSFHHLNETPPADPWVVVAYDVMTPGGCPVLYRHVFDVERETLRLRAETFTLVVARDGVVHVDGVRLAPGDSHVLAWDAEGGRAEAQVQHLGAWPESGLRTEWPPAQ